MKLSEDQKKVIEVLKKYPHDMIMFDGYMTGGHGIRIKLNTVNALKRLKIIENGKLTDIGKNI